MALWLCAWCGLACSALLLVLLPLMLFFFTFINLALEVCGVVAEVRGQVWWNSSLGVSNLRVLEECLLLCYQETCKHIESQLVCRAGKKCFCQGSSGWAADCLCDSRKYPSISSGSGSRKGEWFCNHEQHCPVLAHSCLEGKGCFPALEE